jgi:hypothetical protein
MRYARYWLAGAGVCVAAAVGFALLFGTDSQAWGWPAGAAIGCVFQAVLALVVTWAHGQRERAAAEFEELVRAYRDRGSR